MRNATRAFRDSDAQLKIEVDITLKDGTELQLTNKNIMMGGLSLKDASSGESTFDIGSCVCREAVIKIDNSDETYSEYDFSNARVGISAKKLIGDEYEIISLGKYFLDCPEYSGSVITLSCVDYMFLLNEKVKEGMSNGTAQVIVNAICNKFGIVLVTQHFAGYNTEITLPQDLSKLTYRELLGYICQCTCNFARINDNGQMEIKWYDTAAFDGIELIDGGNFRIWEGDIIDGGDFNVYTSEEYFDGSSFTDGICHHFYSNKAETIITDDVVITGVSVKNNKIEKLYGNEGYILSIEGNPLTAGKEAEYAQQIGLRCIGMRFRPFNITARSNILVEAGDSCFITDRKGNSYQSYVTKCEYAIGSGLTVACNAESPLLNSAEKFSVVTKAVIKAREDTEQQITAYDAAVQQLTDMMANAFGVYKTAKEQEDGSFIYYMHNKKSLEESSTIWKMTADAFAVSTDSGKTWNAGFDSSGNAVVNVLNAIGINADWINAGTLTGRKINNGNGTFSVNESGEVVANKFKSNSAEITGGSINIKANDRNQSFINFSFPSSSLSMQLGIGALIYDSATYNANYSSYNCIFADKDGYTAVLQSKALSIYGNDQGSYIRPNSIITTGDVSCAHVYESSDARLKNDRKYISENERSILDNLEIFTYTFKADSSKKRHIGIYAQELLNIMSELKLDNYALVSEDDRGYYSINYTELIPLLIADRKIMKQDFNVYKEKTEVIIQKLEERISVLENGYNKCNHAAETRTAQST